MATPVTSAPRVPRLHATASGASTPPEKPLPRERLRSRPRGVTRSALLISALVHVVAILLYPLWARREVQVPFVGERPPQVRPSGIEVIRMTEVAELAVSEVRPVVAPVRPAVTPPPTSVVAEPAVVDPAVVGAPPPASPRPPVAERLRPGEVDARLWTFSPQATELTAVQLAQLQLLWTILDMSDSAAAAAARSVIDWTFSDEDGGRWGVSEQGIHLGNITIPLPFSFGAAPGSEAARRAWMDAEIDRAAGSAAARENLDERIRAIRERLDRLRLVQPRDTVGSP